MSKTQGKAVHNKRCTLLYSLEISQPGGNLVYFKVQLVGCIRSHVLKEEVEDFFFFFCLTWHRGGKCGELLRSLKTSPECGFVALRLVLFFSSPFKAGTVTTGSNKLPQQWEDFFFFFFF